MRCTKRHIPGSCKTLHRFYDSKASPVYRIRTHLPAEVLYTEREINRDLSSNPSACDCPPDCLDAELHIHITLHVALTRVLQYKPSLFAMSLSVGRVGVATVRYLPGHGLKPRIWKFLPWWEVLL